MTQSLKWYQCLKRWYETRGPIRDNDIGNYSAFQGLISAPTHFLWVNCEVDQTHTPQKGRTVHRFPLLLWVLLLITDMDSFFYFSSSGDQTCFDRSWRHTHNIRLSKEMPNPDAQKHLSVMKSLIASRHGCWTYCLKFIIYFKLKWLKTVDLVPCCCLVYLFFSSLIFEDVSTLWAWRWITHTGSFSVSCHSSCAYQSWCEKSQRITITKQLLAFVRRLWARVHEERARRDRWRLRQKETLPRRLGNWRKEKEENDESDWETNPTLLVPSHWLPSWTSQTWYYHWFAG